MAHATLDIPTDPFERREWVIYQLRLRGTTLTGLGRARGVSRQAVSQALFAPSYEIERAIAKALGIPVRRLFPERFDEHGHRLHAIRGRPRPKGSTRRLGRNGEKRRVA